MTGKNEEKENKNLPEKIEITILQNFSIGKILKLSVSFSFTLTQF